MVKMKCAEAVVRCLERQGVTTVFGYPGGSVLDLYQALRGSEQIKHVLTRTEQGAAHAANGFARRTGRVGVCIATSGPGATNLVTGIGTAYMDSIPLVAITGQVATSQVGSDAFQEVDIYGITKPIVKHNYLVTTTDNIADIIAEAFHIAGTGRPGPVLIDIPKDILSSMCDVNIPGKISLPGYKPTIHGNQGQIKNACAMLQQAERPLIYAGGGVVAAHAEAALLELAQTLQAPVCVTLMGKSVFPPFHPLYAGFMGLHGWPSANNAVAECDVLLAVGARFDDRVICDAARFANQAKIIHVDIDPAEIGKNIAADCPIVGDANSIIKDMLKRLQPAEHEQWVQQIAKWRKLNDKVYPGMPKDHLTARAVLAALSELTEGKAVLVTDVGQHQMLAAQFYNSTIERGFISSGGLGTMGYGVPAAVGAQMADPQSTVICVCGDGGFQMSLNELATAREQNLPIKYLLFNNGKLGMVRQLQKHYCDANYFAVDMPGNPDFIKLAEAYDMATFRIEKPQQIKTVLKKALSNGKLTLIECTISPDEMVYPMVLGGHAINDMLIGDNE